MQYVEPKIMKPEIIKPQKPTEQTPTMESDEVKIALEILLGIKPANNDNNSELIQAAKQHRTLIELLTKIYGGAL